MAARGLLEKVKANLIIQFNDDDNILEGYITAAIAYAESYQHLSSGYYATHDMNATTEQGVIMLASYFYESRDGSSGGYFSSSVSGSQQALETINMMLRLDREWKV